MEMKMRTLNLSKQIATSVAAIAIGLAGMSAFAQPGPGAGMAGPGAHRGMMAGPAGDGMGIPMLRHRLNLSAEQSTALDAILANAKTQARAAHTAAQPTIAQITAELAKAQPNLHTIAQLRDSLQPAHETLRKATRDQLITFYGTLNATQQQVVIDAMRKRAEHQMNRMAGRLGS
jgi:hypothetical protein